MMAKYIFAGIALMSFLGTAGYYISDYIERGHTIEIQEQSIANQGLAIDELKRANVDYTSTVKRLEKANSDLQASYVAEKTNRDKADAALALSAKEKEDALAVFRKKCNRVETILDRKPTLFVRRANAATERLRVKLEAATSETNDR